MTVSLTTRDEIALISINNPPVNAIGQAVRAGLLDALSSAIAYGIDQVVLRRIPVRRFAVLLALLPVSAMILGFVALSQTPSALDLLGAALVIAGVLIQDREELEIAQPA